MGVTLGTLLGPYEILSAIGVGGMGEVYRAHDTKLGRDVAIKVLPLDVASDPERGSAMCGCMIFAARRQALVRRLV